MDSAFSAVKIQFNISVTGSKNTFQRAGLSVTHCVVCHTQILVGPGDLRLDL